MMKIGYSRMFLGGVVINVVLTLLLMMSVVIGMMSEKDVSSSDVSLTWFMLIMMLVLGSPISGLLCMLVLALFGKEEDKTFDVKEEPKEKIIYVVKEEQKKKQEDNTRYMPH